MPISRHTVKVGYMDKFRTLNSDVLRIVNGSILKLCCYEKPYDPVYLGKNICAWRGKWDFEGRQRTNTRGFWCLECFNLKVFALSQHDKHVLHA